jgi:hypothetical protein
MCRKTAAASEEETLLIPQVWWWQKVWGIDIILRTANSANCLIQDSDSNEQLLYKTLSFQSSNEKSTKLSANSAYYLILMNSAYCLIL